MAVSRKIKTRKLRLKKTKDYFSNVIGSIVSSWRMNSSITLSVIIAVILLGMIVFQEEKEINLKIQLKKLQYKKMELENEKQKLILERTGLENHERIKKIALETLGLTETEKKQYIILKTTN